MEITLNESGDFPIFFVILPILRDFVVGFLDWFSVNNNIRWNQYLIFRVIQTYLMFVSQIVLLVVKK